MSDRWLLAALMAANISMVVVPTWAAEPESVKFTGVQIQDAFRAVLVADSFLMAGNLDVKEVQGLRYFISVGVTVNKEAISGDPKDRLQSQKVANSKAVAAIAKHIESEVETMTALDSTKEETLTTNGDSKERTRRVSKVLQEITRERAQMMLRGIKEIGQWVSADGKLFYVAVAMPLEAGTP